jgi:hypothetical protein
MQCASGEFIAQQSPSCAVEQPDSKGVDRIVMEASADSNGNFRFCPLPPGPFDVVVVAVGPNNLPYNATAVVNVPNGTNLSAMQSSSCPSARAFAPRFFQTSPHGSALALRYHFTSIWL